MRRVYIRDEQEVRLEARGLEVDRDYTIEVVWPDGRKQVEKLSGNVRLRSRLTELESELREQNWIGQTDVTSDAAGGPVPTVTERRSHADRRRVTRRDRRSNT